VQIECIHLSNDREFLRKGGSSPRGEGGKGLLSTLQASGTSDSCCPDLGWNAFFGRHQDRQFGSGDRARRRLDQRRAGQFQRDNVIPMTFTTSLFEYGALPERTI